MGLQDLFVAASIPVLKVLLLTALGSFLALDRVNILGEDARKHMNNVGFYVFNPALISSNLSKTITYDSLVTWWFMPVNILITFIVGSVLGWVVILITRAPPHLKGLILGCCAAGNLGNMPLIIIPAVCKEKGCPFGDPDICYSNGMAYATLSMAVGAVFLWSYVFNIVRIYSNKTEDIKLNVSTKSVKLSEETLRLFPESCTEELLPSKDCSISEDQISLPCSISYDKVEVPFSVIQHLKMLAEKVEWNRLFAPSTIGAIVGFVIGVVPQIRMLLIGESAPLRVIQDSTSLLRQHEEVDRRHGMRLLGSTPPKRISPGSQDLRSFFVFLLSLSICSDGAIPTLTLIVGGNLTKGSKGSGVKMSLILGITIVRYILLPLCGVLVVKGAVCFGLIHSDPLYQFVLMLQFTLPPAMNIGTMTQLFGAGETECSVIMLWTYTLASVALTLWCTYFMWLVS